MADGFQSTPSLNLPIMTRRSFSVVDLDAMFDAQILSRDEKIELIDGEIIQMNSQMMPHGVLKSRLTRKLSQILADTFDIVVEGSTILNELTLVDPDILIANRLTIERRYIRNTELLLAIEVADTSLAYDLGIKARLYARANIPELWVVDINGAQTWVHRQPSEGGYASIVSVPFASALTPLLDGSATMIIGELIS